jgi:hypothetical protein
MMLGFVRRRAICNVALICGEVRGRLKNYLFAATVAEAAAELEVTGCNRIAAALGRCEHEIKIMSGGDGRGGGGLVPV